MRRCSSVLALGLGLFGLSGWLLGLSSGSSLGLGGLLLLLGSSLLLLFEGCLLL